MIDVDVGEEKENVLNFNLNKNITAYKDFIEYFYNLSVDDKNEIIFYMLLYKKYFSELKNGNLDKMYNMYKILLHKLEYDKLNYKEKFIYEHIMAYLIISGNFKNDELFEKYVCVYLSNVTKCNFNNRLFIILQDIVNKLNKEYNKECTLKFVDQDAIASTNWFNKDLRYNILLSSNKFWRNYELKKIDDINLLYTFVTNAFIILHEYKHILQNEYMRNIDDDLAKIYKFESYNVQFNYRLYDTNHHGFYIEKEANKFALDNCYRFIKCYFKDSNIKEDDIRKFNINKWDIDYKDKKTFIIFYKMLKKLFDEFDKKNINTKKLKLFKSKLNEKF